MSIYGNARYGTEPYGTLLRTAQAAGPVWLYLSDREGYASFPDDSLPNQLFQPRVQIPLNMERNLPVSPDSSTRNTEIVAEIVLTNADGYFDSIIADSAIDGRDIIVRFGEPGFSYDDFAILFKGTAKGWRHVDDTAIRIDLRDASWELELPIQTNTYAGGGGLNGSDNLKGRYKPLLFGQCFNVSAVLVDATKLIYQVHDGAMSEISVVRDSAYALIYDGNVSDIVAAPTPAAGHYITQLSGGYFRLGSQPFGQVTADCKGDITPYYTDNPRNIIHRVLNGRMGLSSQKIDNQSFEIFNNKQSSPIGVYVGTDLTSGSVFLDAVLRGMGGWWGCNRFGRIQIGRIDAPADWAIVATLDDSVILALDRIDGPDTINPPNYRRRIGYARNWTVQNSDIAAGVTIAHKEYISTEFRYVEAIDLNVRQKHLRAQDPEAVPSLFVNQADAQAECDRQLALFKTLRPFYRVTLKLPAYLLELGSTVRIKYPRYNLSAGVAALIVGSRVDTQRNEVTLTVMV